MYCCKKNDYPNLPGVAMLFPYSDLLKKTEK